MTTNIYGTLIFMVVNLLLFLLIYALLVKIFGQKTRNPQQRRMYVGNRARPSLGPTEPSVYVSPSNLPPPPKYECMAPPSYDEVVGVHCPQYQPQPITQPIAEALANAVAHSTSLAQGSTSNSSQNVLPVTRNNNGNSVTETIVTVPDTRPPAVATSS